MMFEGYGSYVRERDENRVPTQDEKDAASARRQYVADRAAELLGSVKLAEAIQDDMTGHFGHEPQAIAMMLSKAIASGDWHDITRRVVQIAKDVAQREWGL